MKASLRFKKRDEFSVKVKSLIASRVHYRCSNPACRVSTSGPHEDVQKFVNIGFAAHISAAAPQGPRYDPLLTKQQRGGMDNAIWLCGKCAKLIDSDEPHYTVPLLHAWKVAAEAAARHELEAGRPQETSKKHIKVPQILNIAYHSARKLLIEAGWQPITTWWPDEALLLAKRYGNGKEFWDRGYYEIKAACPTGFAFCRFEFTDMYRNKLVVITAGEECAKFEAQAGVVNWFIEPA